MVTSPQQLYYKLSSIDENRLSSAILPMALGILSSVCLICIMHVALCTRSAYSTCSIKIYPLYVKHVTATWSGQKYPCDLPLATKITYTQPMGHTCTCIVLVFRNT